MISTDRIIAGCKATRLHELTVTRIEAYLNEEGISGHTRNTYIQTLKTFIRWAVETDRLREDPLRALKATPQSKIDPVHPRRALTVSEIDRLLEAAESRPLIEAQTVRTGKDKSKLIAKAHDRVKRKRSRLGRERRLAYLIAVWTGLRRSEIKKLQWRDVDLDAQIPCLRLRREATKARRNDMLVLHPQLADALKKARPGNVAGTAHIVRTVPDMKTFRADLVASGIDPGDRTTGYIDFHSLRMTLSTMMATAGMSQRVRQSHMRHSDPRLTEKTYMDERLLPVASALCRVPAIGGEGTATANTQPTLEPTKPTDLHPKTGRLGAGVVMGWQRGARARIRDVG
jgi:integrase